MDTLIGRVFPSLGLLLVGACAAEDGAAIDFRIVHASDDDPYAGGASLVVGLQQVGGTQLQSELSFPIDADSGEAPLVPDGDGWVFRVEVRAPAPSGGRFALANGRSFPFSVRDGTPPADRPDVLLGSLGRFLTPTEDALPIAAVAAAPIEGGALIATVEGDLFRYRAHDASRDGAAALSHVTAVPERAGAHWIAVGAGLLLAVGGVEPGASLHDASGETLAMLDGAAVARHAHGAAAVAVPQDRAALLLGGAAHPSGPAERAITRIAVEADATGRFRLRATRAAVDLATARMNGTGVAVPVHDPDGACPCARVVLFGGTNGLSHLRSVELIDPAGRDSSVMLVVTPELDGPVHGAAAAAVDEGFVILAGGVAPGEPPTGRVVALDVRPGSIRLVSPDPPPMMPARTGAAALRFGGELVLVVGGVDATGAAVGSAELYDFETNRFGEVASTGALPAAQRSPVATLLADGTILVAGEDHPAIYFPPRGDGP